MWCDVQLTKDGVGVCLQDINMKNCTTVDQAYPARERTYVIDGVRKTGWFGSDFTIAELQSVFQYLNFINDGGFSVDGVLSEHPITASEAIGCFTKLNSNKNDHGEPLVISHNGASRDYPDCTDLAYHSAIDDGARFLPPHKRYKLIIILLTGPLYTTKISSPNAVFLVNSLGIDIVDSVTTALSAAGFRNHPTKEVLIQSKDSGVLVKLKQQKTKCKLVYTLPSGIGDASNSSLKDIKQFAEAVVVDSKSVFTLSSDFIIRQNSLVQYLHSAGLALYAEVFRNEFVAQPLDFFGDETVEINYYVQSFNLSGIITDFPKTVRRYKIVKKTLVQFWEGYAQLHAACSGWLACTVSPNLQNPAAISATNADTEFFKRGGATSSYCCVKRCI
ncbi:unnamed protein product [Miscanthus lutarioriparius]|uniref:glycerophosphodiester phosphodiesterase n=1 Tax=Miscanthus lutarioriparius TaxID=422564 RepID=A0A811N311_9POAL|nr:unnamed protein product [Miscanthus lutarioriparius]